MQTVADILGALAGTGDAKSLEGMARFGITPDKAFGTRMPVLRQMGRRIGRNHPLALELWAAGYRETQILASLVADIQAVTGDLMDAWTASFTYWEICDQCVMNCFEKTALARDKAFEYVRRPEEFVKRTGFVLMARLAGRGRPEDDDLVRSFLPEIEAGASDGRPLVKKAVSWALRDIGKRGGQWTGVALSVAQRLLASGSSSAAWVARDTIHDLESPAAQRRMARRTSRP